MATVFDLIDRNNDGVITRSEWNGAFSGSIPPTQVAMSHVRLMIVCPNGVCKACQHQDMSSHAMGEGYRPRTLY